MSLRRVWRGRHRCRARGFALRRNTLRSSNVRPDLEVNVDHKVERFATGVTAPQPAYNPLLKSFVGDYISGKTEGADTTDWDCQILCVSGCGCH